MNTPDTAHDANDDMESALLLAAAFTAIILGIFEPVPVAFRHQQEVPPPAALVPQPPRETK